LLKREGALNFSYYPSYSIILAMDFKLKGISFPQGVEGEVV
jgi:hypothetical protein